ncbi:MAG TPA: hypothetical protein VNG89_27370, partial [Vicinamibacterales bacterium]|nr:hypothetical protein [Vicinamibacterales bacterium]
RRAAWSRRLARDQRLEAQRVANAQRAIRARIRAIPIHRRTRVANVGTLQGAGVVTAILPNGRRSRMRIIPTVAPISEVNRLRSVVLANEKRQATAIATNARAVSSLATAQGTAFKRLTDAQVKSDRELSQRIVQGDNRLDARITKELSGGSGILDKHNKRLIRVLKRERRRAMMNNVLLATAVPFYLAYGDRESPFTRDNFMITGSTLLFLLGDDILSAWAKDKGGLQNFASIWSYTGWAANGGLLYLLFRNKQNKRFIAGVTLVASGPDGTTVDLSGEIKKRGQDDFKNQNHVVVATFADPAATGDIRATMSGGKLTLTISSTGYDGASRPAANVAWIVDTTERKAINS